MTVSSARNISKITADSWVKKYQPGLTKHRRHFLSVGDIRKEFGGGGG